MDRLESLPLYTICNVKLYIVFIDVLILMCNTMPTFFYFSTIVAIVNISCKFISCVRLLFYMPCIKNIAGTSVY